MTWLRIPGGYRSSAGDEVDHLGDRWVLWRPAPGALAYGGTFETLREAIVVVERRPSLRMEGA